MTGSASFSSDVRVPICAGIPEGDLRKPLGDSQKNREESLKAAHMTSGDQAPIPQFGNRRDDRDYIDRPGAYAVIENHEGRIAFIETGNGYFLPGGGMDPGESDVDALNREVMEEIGYQISILGEIGQAVEYIEARSEGKHYRIHGRFYKVQLGSKVGNEVEKDHGLVWLFPEDAINLLNRQGQAWAIQIIVKERGKNERF